MKLTIASVSALAGLATALPRAHTVQKRAPLEPFVGTNAYWLPFLTSDDDVDKSFQAYVPLLLYKPPLPCHIPPLKRKLEAFY